jgi:hypothetical protein
MDEFTPSPDFRDRVMDDVRSYERRLSRRNHRIQAFLHSGPGLLMVAAASALFAIVQLIRLTSILIFPVLCH